MLPISLRREIMNHLESGDKTSGLPLAQTLSKQFPQYIFKGEAYRAIISLEEIGEVQLHPGDSFMTQVDAIDQFFKDNGLELYEDSQGVVIQAEIVGFNLEQFLRHEMSLFPKGDHEDLEAYLAEKEVIALEIIKVIDEYDYIP
jgi:hypothetical protein